MHCSNKYWIINSGNQLIMKNKNVLIGLIFGAGIGIIFNPTGLGLPMGAGVGLVLGLIIDQQQKMNLKNKK